MVWVEVGWKRAVHPCNFGEKGTECWDKVQVFVTVHLLILVQQLTAIKYKDAQWSSSPPDEMFLHYVKWLARGFFHAVCHLDQKSGSATVSWLLQNNTHMFFYSVFSQNICLMPEWTHTKLGQSRLSLKKCTELKNPKCFFKAHCCALQYTVLHSTSRLGFQRAAKCDWFCISVLSMDALDLRQSVGWKKKIPVIFFSSTDH